MGVEAIQVLESVDDSLRTGGKVEVKKIKTVHHFRDGPSLKEVLLCKGVKDLPVLVFSIAGKTRGGKSFLLNLMIKHLEHLESKGNVDWLSGSVPNSFIWRNGIESITRGLWIFPKIFRLKDLSGNEVGVMLLDTEGMYDGEATDGEIIAISGISAAISYLQMFNIKEKIASDYLESVVRNLIKGIEQMDSEDKSDLKNNYKLMFVVRDWIGEEKYPFGLQGGKDYIQNESGRGTRENQQLWQVIHQTFREVNCLLLPDPGRAVTKKDFNQTGDLAMLDEEFLREVKGFVENLFKSDNLKPPSMPLTGQDIYSVLTSIDGKIADEDLSFMNIYTDQGNFIKVEQWRSGFEEMLNDVTYSELLKAKSEMMNIICKAKQTLRGKSRTTHLTELTKAIEGHFNQKVIKIILKQYKMSFLPDENIEKKQKKIWKDVNHKLQEHLCENNETRLKAKQIFIKKSAAYYYNLLHQDHKRRFAFKCSTLESLEDCAGLDEKEIKSFKECEDFTDDENNKEAVYPLWLKEYQCLKNEFMNILLQKIENITTISMDTLKKLRRKQYEYFENFTLLNEDEVSNGNESVSSKEILAAKKVGFGLYGLPGPLRIALSQKNQELGFTEKCFNWFGKATVPAISLVSIAATALSSFVSLSQSAPNTYTGYTADQESKIKDIVNKIFSLSNDKATFSCIFLVYDQENGTVNVPIFRVKTKSGKYEYLDSNCRHYSGWDHFLGTNTLPDVVFCYPLNGSYIKTEGFGIAFSETPASKVTYKVLQTADTVAKGVTVAAGVVGCAAGLGVTAPIVGGFAVVGGGVAVAYGLVRGFQKVKDKIDHGEPVTSKDFINVFTYTNDTPELISLIAEMEDISLKILFYFGTTCSTDALIVIRKSLKLENKSTADTLVALVENNCIQFAAETGTGDVRVEKYVSQNQASLVTSILKVVCPDVRDILLHYCELHSVFHIVNEENRNEAMERMQNLMRKLFVELEDEISVSKVRFENVLRRNQDLFADESTFIQSFLDMLDAEEGHELVLAFRHLVCSLVSALRKANQFFNNIDHDAITLKDHYLEDVLFHPYHEVTQKIKDMVEQTESAIDLKATSVKELNCLILEVLKLIKQQSYEAFSINQFARCLINITQEIVSRSENVVNDHKEFVGGKLRISCNELDVLFKELGVKGHHYGMLVLKKVLSEVDGSAMENMALCQPVAGNLSIIPAWSGILDRLYFYCSKSPVSDKLVLIKQIKNVREYKYKKLYTLQDTNKNLNIFIPRDEEMSPFVVYSELVNGNEQGFIWLLKEDE